MNATPAKAPAMNQSSPTNEFFERGLAAADAEVMVAVHNISDGGMASSLMSA